MITNQELTKKLMPAIRKAINENPKKSVYEIPLTNGRLNELRNNEERTLRTSYLIIGIVNITFEGNPSNPKRTVYFFPYIKRKREKIHERTSPPIFPIPDGSTGDYYPKIMRSHAP